jgi:hypothetical protein
MIDLEELDRCDHHILANLFTKIQCLGIQVTHLVCCHIIVVIVMSYLIVRMKRMRAIKSK